MAAKLKNSIPLNLKKEKKQNREVHSAALHLSKHKHPPFKLKKEENSWQVI